MPDALSTHSVSLLLTHQAPGGAFPASPTFTPYRYSWFRDGAFSAHALDLEGETRAARRFHEWAIATIDRHQDRLANTMARVAGNQPVDPAGCFPCRFTLDGRPLNDNWGNFQLDGLGTWLWVACNHVARTHPAGLPAKWRKPVRLLVDYLIALWDQPCWDCWEEYPGRVHTYTLAAIYAGLSSYASLTQDAQSRHVADQLRAFVLEGAVANSHLIKYSGSSEVDASLLAVAVPYHLLEPEHPIMLGTVARIEQDLVSSGGGVHRYRADQYYGGGEWVLLTAWLGWYYAAVGDLDHAREKLNWVERAADKKMNLPEQRFDHLLHPGARAEWLERWGPAATLLLWSHSMLLILKGAIRAREALESQ